MTFRDGNSKHVPDLQLRKSRLHTKLISKHIAAALASHQDVPTSSSNGSGGGKPRVMVIGEAHIFETHCLVTTCEGPTACFMYSHSMYTHTLVAIETAGMQHPSSLPVAHAAVQVSVYVLPI